MSRPRRENIRDVDPRQRSPAHRIKAHIDIQHGGHRLRSRGRAWWRAVDSGWGRVGLQNGTNNVEEGAHAEGRDEEGSFSTERFDTKEDEDGGSNDFDDTINS